MVRAFRLTSYVSKYDWRVRQTRRDLGGGSNCAHAPQFCRPTLAPGTNGFSADPLQHVLAGGCGSLWNLRGRHPRPKPDPLSSPFLRGASGAKRHLWPDAAPALHCGNGLGDWLGATLVEQALIRGRTAAPAPAECESPNGRECWANASSSRNMQFNERRVRRFLPSII